MEDPLTGDVMVSSSVEPTYAMEEEGAEALLKEEDDSEEYNIHESSDKEEDSLIQYLSDGDGDELADFKFPELEMGLNSAICIQNLPLTTSAEQHSKLIVVVCKICRSIDGSVAEDSIYMPKQASEKEKDFEGCRFAFVNFSNVECARKAVSSLDGFQLSKAHTLKVMPYSRLQSIYQAPEEYEPPPPLPLRQHAYTTSWLADNHYRDQFVLRYSNPTKDEKLGPSHETEIMWCESGQPPQLCYGGEREKSAGKAWVKLYVLWSPQGTYLATIHDQGVALWGGDEFMEQHRFKHAGVKFVSFSPCERYLLTCNYDDSDTAFIVWDICKVSPIRSFYKFSSPGNAASGAGSEQVPDFFKWSHDGRFLARKGKDRISIYVLPGMKLLNTKSLKATGVEDFEWCPKELSILAYWAPEQDNTPARVSVVDIPSGKDLRQKNLFNVRECRLHWHPDGTYLCVKVMRHSKSKKTMYNNFELFRVKDPGVPVEMLELRNEVIAFAWEPCGDRFTIVHGDARRSGVTFWTMKGGEEGDELTEVVTLEDVSVNHLYWSPQGQNILMAGVGEKMQGKLIFYDVEYQTILKEDEHYRLVYVSWDPSGRLVCTAVNQLVEGGHYKAQMDNGYKLWTFQGECFYEYTKEQFYQILWRPRPASLLSLDERKKVVKNLKKYERRFERADRTAARSKRRAAMADKVRKKQEFREKIRVYSDAVRARRQELVDIRGGYDSDDESHYVVRGRTREVVIDVQVKVL